MSPGDRIPGSALPRTMASARELLDEALLGLRAIADPVVRVRDAERELAAALLHTYRALASAGEARVYDEESACALGRARAALGALQDIPSGDPGLSGETGRVADAVQILARSPEPPELAPTLPGANAGHRTLRASKREPLLLDLDRPLLYPTIPLPPLGEPDAAPEAPSPPAPPAIATGEQIAALVTEAKAAIGLSAALEQPPEPDAPPPPPPPPQESALEREYLGIVLDDRELTLERAEACFEDLGAFGMMRTPQPEEGWMSADRVERRLLARIDGIAACGTWVLPRLVKVLEEQPVPDPDLTWGAVFLFTSLVGDDAVDQALRLARASELDVPGMLDSIADAFALAPHPAIEPAMRRWLEDPDPRQRVIGLRVLGRRRRVTPDEVARATSDSDARVVLAGAEAAAGAAGEIPAWLLEPLLYHVEPSIARAAMMSATARRIAQGVLRAQELTSEGKGDHADAALFVAIAGGQESRGLLRDSSAATGSVVCIEALGWCGDLERVGFLLGQLRHGEETTKAAAVEALEMLTGAGLTEATPVPEYLAGAEPFVAPPAAPEEVGPLLLDPDPWEAWWQRYKRGAKPGQRYRFGHPWTPRDSLWQMELPWARTRGRVLAHLELCARLGGGFPLDVHDFVPVQQRAIKQWSDYLALRHDRVAPGSWTTSFAR